MTTTRHVCTGILLNASTKRKVFAKAESVCVFFHSEKENQGDGKKKTRKDPHLYRQRFSLSEGRPDAGISGEIANQFFQETENIDVKKFRIQGGRLAVGPLFGLEWCLWDFAGLNSKNGLPKWAILSQFGPPFGVKQNGILKILRTFSKTTMDRPKCMLCEA